LTFDILTGILMIMKNINTAVVGVGRLGSIHARLYKQISNLVCVCDIDRKREHNILNTIKRIPFETDYRKIKEKYNLEAVSIATPTSSHFSQAEFFLKNGIHCLVEKPLVTDLKQARYLLHLARKKNLVFHVGLSERFNSAYQTVKNKIKKPHFIESHRLSPYPYRSLDISVVLDLMIHDLDITLDLVGEKIKKVEAVGVSVLSKSLDIANARITFSGGAIANITASRISKESVRKIRVFFSSAYASLDYAHQSVEIYRKTNKNKINSQKLAIKKEEPLKKELEKFLREIKSGRPDYTSTDNAIKALELALKIEKLAQE